MAWSDAANSFIEWAKGQPFQNVLTVLILVVLVLGYYQKSQDEGRREASMSATIAEVSRLDREARAEDNRRFSENSKLLAETCCGNER